ncbi:MAG: hypothetical protein WBG19_00265 [Thermoplasmata archaeon]
MKKCTYCGKEYSDDVLNCPLDGQPVTAEGTPATAPPRVPPQKSQNGRYLKYEDVPWYRREPGALAFVGVLFCGFVTIALCVICLTGDVYKNAYDKDGNLKVWGVGNKIAAFFILALQVFIFWVFRQTVHK